MKANTLKRLGAVLIDVVIIILITSVIALVIPTTKTDSYLNQQTELTEQLMEGEISLNEATTQLQTITYKIDRANIVLNLLSLVVSILYYGVYQFVKKQTIGKKVFKIKVAGSNLTMNTMIIRTLLVYGLFATILNVIAIYVLNQESYFYFSTILNSLYGLFFIITVFMILFREDKKGLHDLIMHTEVMEVQ